MAKQFGTGINLLGNELQNAVIQNLAAAPGSPIAGRVYFDTVLGFFRVYNGTTWTDLAPGGTDAEAVRDVINAALVAGTQSGITVTPSDASDNISFTVAADGAAGTPTLRTLGTAATSAAAGNDARLSDARTPTAGSVVDASVSASAAINADKIANGTTNKVYTATEQTKLAAITNDAVAGTASLRTLGTGAQQAAAGNHTHVAANVTDFQTTVSANTDVTANTAARHTHSNKAILDATTASYLTADSTKLAGIAAGATNYTDTNARANRLDQFAVPTATVNFNSQLLSNVLTPVSGTDAANKNYVDSTAQGLDVKPSVVVATTAAITLSGAQTIDGVAVVAGNRVLVKNQASAPTNGIYVVAAGAWPRSSDFDSAADISGGAFVFIEQGTTQADTGWVMTTNNPVTLGTTNLDWAQFSSAGTIYDGAGLVKSGSTISVGSGTGITVAADSIAIDPTVVPRLYTTTFGNGAATSYVITHNLNTRAVIVQVFLNSGTFEEVEFDIQRTSVNTVTIISTAVVATNAYQVVVHG
jgi:hypothetical protein